MQGVLKVSHHSGEMQEIHGSWYKTPVEMVIEAEDLLTTDEVSSVEWEDAWGNIFAPDSEFLYSFSALIDREAVTASEKHNQHVLKRAHAGYVDVDGREGRYIDDFMSVYGKSDCRGCLLKVSLGNPHCAGRGVSFVDPIKLKRRIRDALNKTNEDDFDTLLRLARELQVAVK